MTLCSEDKAEKEEARHILAQLVRDFCREERLGHIKLNPIYLVPGVMDSIAGNQHEALNIGNALFIVMKDKTLGVGKARLCLERVVPSEAVTYFPDIPALFLGQVNKGAMIDNLLACHRRILPRSRSRFSFNASCGRGSSRRLTPSALQQRLPYPSVSALVQPCALRVPAKRAVRLHPQW